MALRELPSWLKLELVSIAISLFRSNVAALLGEFYEENDPRRDAGYTLYYTGINIGGFLATVLCGAVGEIFGWHAGFSLAALGMLSGNILLLLGKKLLKGKGEKSSVSKKAQGISIMGILFSAYLFTLAIYQYHYVSSAIPFIAFGAMGYAFWKISENSIEQKSSFKKLGLYVLFLIIYFICEEQLGSSLVLFAERHLDRNTLFGLIPAASMITFNPLTILLTGPLLSRMMSKIPMSGINKIGISFLFLGIAFCTLYVGCFFANKEEMVPLSFGISSIILIGLGEIFIGPTVYAYAAEVAPKSLQGLTMGIVTLGFALANLFSGVVSQMMAISDEMASLDIYSGSFKMIGLTILGFACLILLVNSQRKVFAT